MFPNIYLIVGVCSDKDIKEHKGTNVMTEKERVESVRHCKWVDEIYFPAPWSPTINFLKKNKFDFIAHDSIPYTVLNEEDCYSDMKEVGMFLPTLRTEGISTSDILVKILKDREDYYTRNLKKGIDRKTMNLNYFEYLYLQLKNIAGDVGTCLKKFDDDKIKHLLENSPIESPLKPNKKRERSYNKKH